MSLPAPFRCAIFDMDGTVLDSMPVWDTLGEDYLRSLGRPVPPGLRGVLAPLSMQQTASYLMDRCGVPGPAERIIDDINALVADFYRNTAPAKPGAAELLSCLLSVWFLRRKRADFGFGGGDLPRHGGRGGGRT